MKTHTPLVHLWLTVLRVASKGLLFVNLLTYIYRSNVYSDGQWLRFLQAQCNDHLKIWGYLYGRLLTLGTGKIFHHALWHALSFGESYWHRHLQHHNLIANRMAKLPWSCQCPSLSMYRAHRSTLSAFMKEGWFSDIVHQKQMLYNEFKKQSCHYNIKFINYYCDTHLCWFEFVLER